MKQRMTPLGLLFAAIALVMICGSALAYFSANGTGTASASVGKLLAAKPTATAVAGGKVNLSWTASTAPGAGTVTYYITRDGKAPGGTCPTEASPGTGLSCVDENVPIGAHEYTLTALWQSWTTTGLVTTVTVTVGVATQFSITASSATPAAGAADNLTIAAKDEKGSTVTTFTGSHNLVFSGAGNGPTGTAPNVANSSGTAIAFGSATALTFTSGVASVSSSKNGVLKICKLGEASINATEGSLTDPTPLELNVVAGALTKYTMTGTTPIEAGAEDPLTITAFDTCGNVATGYTGSKNLTFTGPTASPNATAPTITDSGGKEVALGTATPILFSEGVAEAAEGKNGVANLYKTGTNSLKVAEGSINVTLAITVTAAPASSMTMTASPTTVAAGGTETLTLTALDPYGNTATGYTGTKNIVFSGATASPLNNQPTVTNASGTAINFGSTTTVAFASGVKAVSAKLYKMGSASVVATDGTLTTNTVPITVTYGAASRVAWVNLTQSAGAGASSCFVTCTITAVGNSGTVTGNLEIIDAYGNVVSNYGASKTITVTATTGTITGSPLALPETGPAVTSTTFTYTYPSTGTTTATLTGASTSRTSVTGTVAK